MSRPPSQIIRTRYGLLEYAVHGHGPAVILSHGDFIVQQVAGIRDLLGNDVNLVHRLTKNHVSETTGWKGYALFTDPVLERMGQSKDGFFNRCESYEHLGDVSIYCMDMHPRYAEMKSG